jgi:hypothetical protein
MLRGNVNDALIKLGGELLGAYTARLYRKHAQGT